MAHSLDHLAQTVLHKSFDECSEQELLQLVNRYPYFAPAQFLYLKKLDPFTELYKAQYQKAVLYHHDPVLFQYQVESERFETPIHWFVNDAEPTVIEEVPQIQKPIVTTESKQELDIILPTILNEIPKGEGITFEPFHTVDYFASQGIKLSAEDASKDKFGRQVKSFTEWLKTMKRLPATAMPPVQGKVEKQVENLAAHSVETADVVTEAMAEVWLHQGNKAKAGEVYRKLSLLNPSKSAYFASKIELLKDPN